MHKLETVKWKYWKYQISVNISLIKNEWHNAGYKYVHLSFSLLDLIIFLKRNEILKVILHRKIIPIEDWTKVRVLVMETDAVTFVNKKCTWIFETTCIHLASKFNDQGLYILLNYYEQYKKKEIINRLHDNGSVTPLHLAAETDNMSTR